MELKYPINLVGMDTGDTTGDVVTKHGEFVGTWALREDPDTCSGVLTFMEDGGSEPIFSEAIGVVDSGLHRGVAMSQLCAAIRDWHDAES